MSLSKKIYTEGSFFAIPLRDTTFAVGLIIRINDSSVLGHFLNKKFIEIPDPHQISKLFLSLENIALTRIFGSRGLDKRRWPVFGKMDQWKREVWNVPVFGKKDALADYYFKIHYDDNLKFIKQELVSDADKIKNLPKEGSAGYGFIEEVLSDILMGRLG